MRQTNHDPSQPPTDRELSLDELDQVSGGGTSIWSAPNNFVNGFAGGAIYGQNAKESQIAPFGNKNEPLFGAGVEIGMGFNGAMGPVGQEISSLANAVDRGIQAIGSGFNAAYNYFNPTPGHGAPGDLNIMTHLDANGAVVPAHFEAAPIDHSPGSLSDQAGFNDIGHAPAPADQGTVDHSPSSFVPGGVQGEFGVSPGGAPLGVDHSEPTTPADHSEQTVPGSVQDEFGVSSGGAPLGVDHSEPGAPADHSDQTVPAPNESVGSNEHVGEPSTTGGSDPTAAHDSDFNGNDFNGNDFNGSQFASGYGGDGYGGGDFAGSDFGGSDFG